MSGQSVYKVGIVISADASGVKPGVTETKNELASIGAAAGVTQTKMQQLIATATGLHVGAANGNSKAWTGALAAEGMALDNLRAKYNPLFAVIHQYKAAQVEIRTAHAMGTISADEMTAAMQRQRQAALASIDAIKGRNAALGQGSSAGHQNFAATNLMFQAQDVVMTAAMGMNPAMIALQQGSQAAGAVAGMSMKQAGSTIVGALTQLVSPASLAAVAITGVAAAAIQYGTSLFSAASKTATLDEALEHHEDILKRLTARYGLLVDAAKGFTTESSKVLAFDAGTDIRVLRSRANEERGDLFRSTGAILNRVRGGTQGGNDFKVDSEFSMFGDALKKLRGEAKDGKPDFEAFYDALYRTASVDPKYAKKADELAKLVENYRLATRALEEMERVQRRLFDDRGPGGLLLSQGTTNRADLGELALFDSRERVAADRRRKEAEAQLSELNARSPQEKADAARKAVAAQYNADETAPARRQRIETAGTLALAQAEKQLADAKRDRVRSITETVDSQQLELSLIGKTISETEALRMRYQLTSALKAEAAKNGVAVDQDELRLIEEKSRAYGRVAEQMAAINVIRGQQDAIEQQRVELALVGQSDEVRRRSLALLEAEQTIRSQGLTTNSAAADLIRKGALATADQTAEVERLRDAWGEVQSAIEGVVNNGVDKLVDGDWSGALDAVKEQLVGGLTQIGIKNPLANAFDGGNRGTISDLGGLGGIVGRLFGGDAKTPQSIVSGAMQSVASMSVNAASVVINGGIGGDVSRLFSPANGNNAGGNLGFGAGGAGSALSFVGNYKGAGVDPRLTDILNLAAQQTPGFKVDAISGYRAGDPRFHGKGMATDVQLTDLASGKLLGNYQDASSFSAYEKFAQNARQIQMAKYPELAEQFRWGGYFGGGKGKYGALDTMHFDLAGKGMAGGSWDTGLTSAQKSLWPGIESQGNAATKALQNLAGQGDVAAQGLGSLGTGFDKFGSTLSSASAGGASSGGGLFSWLKGLFGGSTQFAAASAGTLKPGLFSDGGWTGPGGVYQPAGIVHAGEVVFSQADVARHGGVGNVEAMRLGRRFGSYASGGAVAVNPLPASAFSPAYGSAGGSNVSIAVNNYSGQEVQTEETTDSRGNKQVTMVIGQQSAAAFKQRGNPARRAMQDEFGVKTRPVRR